MRNLLITTTLLVMRFSIFTTLSFATGNESTNSDRLAAIKNFHQLQELTRVEVEEAIGDVPNQVLNSAYQSHEQLWQFLTHPRTPFLHRLAAADRAFHVFNLNHIPRLAEALCFLDQFNDLVERPPQLVERQWIRQTQFPEKVLGFEWDVPSQLVSYPLSLEAYRDMPFPWQLNKTLNRLLHRLKGKLKNPAYQRQWLTVIATMPITVPERNFAGKGWHLQGEVLYKEESPWDLMNRECHPNDNFRLLSNWVASRKPHLDLWPEKVAVLGKRFAIETYKKSPELNSLSLGLLENWHSEESFWLGYYVLRQGLPSLVDLRGMLSMLSLTAPDFPSDRLLPILATIPKTKEPAKIQAGIPTIPDGTYIPWALEFLKMAGVATEETIKLSTSQMSQQQRESVLLEMVTTQKQYLNELARAHKPHLLWAEKALKTGIVTPFPAQE